MVPSGGQRKEEEGSGQAWSQEEAFAFESGIRGRRSRMVRFYRSEAQLKLIVCILGTSILDRI
jgi:hypothetical protein